VIFLDAYAAIALLAEERAAAEVEAIMRQNDVGISAVNLAEVLDVLARRYRVADDELEPVIRTFLSTPVRIEPCTAPIGWRAGVLRARYYRRHTAELSLSDAVLLATARSADAIATADPVVASTARAEGIALVPLPDTSGAMP
jgi:predicted nucleic acid-binding protein